MFKKSKKASFDTDIEIQPTVPVIEEPIPDVSESDLVPIFVPSKGGYETKSQTVNGESKKYVYGSVNGEYFEVPCDEQVQVHPAIAEALQGLLRSLKK